MSIPTKHPRRLRRACPAQRAGAAASAAVLAGLLAACPLPADAAGPDAAAMEAGRALFTTGAAPACAVCHTLQDAGASGAIGPDLDELRPEAARVEAAVRNGIGVMPAFEALSDEDVAALAAYVAAAAGAQ